MTMKGANFLEKLLDNQPVEWKKLGEVATFYGGLTGKSKEDFNEGNAYYISYKNIYENIAVDATCLERVNVGEGERQHTVEYGDVLITGSSENLEEAGMSSSVTFESETNIYLNSFSFGIRFNEGIELSPEFTKYLFRTNMMRKQIMSTAQGVTRFNVSKKRFATIEIPLPPLSVQSRIVEILDKFTSLEAELEAELDCRKRQYIYYRELLLDFSQNNNIQWKKLGEVAQYSKGRIDASTLSAKNYVGVDNLLQDCQGKKLSEHVPTEGRCTAYSPKDILIGNIRPYLKKIWFADNAGGTNGDVLVIQTTDERVLPEYLYQVLSDDAFFTYDMQHAKGAKMPRGNKDKILDYKIPIPPLSEQARIVEILDKFDTLTNSISEGLPLEIQLRRQQYEYYREQLLAFPHP